MGISAQVPAVIFKAYDIRGIVDETLTTDIVFDIGQAFATSIVESKPENRLNSFNSSINSLAAVLAANISNDRDGEKIVIDEFINNDKYAQYRVNPNR